MKVKPPKEIGDVWLPLDDGDAIQVDAGKTVEVPDELGDRLLEQGWTDPGTPRATVAEILDQVGDDPGRAADALAEEHARGDARVSLAKRLEEIIDKERD